MKFKISNPALCWRLSHRDAANLIENNVPLLDREISPLDFSPKLRWDQISFAVVEIGNKICARDWKVCRDYPGFVEISINGPLPLNQTEKGIVESWFYRSGGVICDPNTNLMENGRHRLMYAISHLEGKMIPIIGGTLGHASAEDKSERLEVAPFLRNQYNDLIYGSNFCLSDPVNAQYMKSLKCGARGKRIIPRPKFRSIPRVSSI